MRNYIKLCYNGALRMIRFFEDGDDLDTQNAFEAVEREWRTLWPSDTPVPPKRFMSRPTACTTTPKTGKIIRGAAACVPLISVWRRPLLKGPLLELPAIGEHVEEAMYLPGPIWVEEAAEAPAAR